MTTASTPKGRKTSIVASSAAIMNEPHQVRKNEKNEWKNVNGSREAWSCGAGGGWWRAAESNARGGHHDRRSAVCQPPPVRPPPSSAHQANARRVLRRRLPADAVVLRRHLTEVKRDPYQVDDDLVRPAAGDSCREFGGRVPDDDHLRALDDLIDRVAEMLRQVRNLFVDVLLVGADQPCQ